ncbi:GNAT family N-acetyltransferase [Bacillus sp. AFS076308]|uniref:GNAT family N-acetyltransferase n=1 Tax=unclassified Bacillus (in: firmicutes) TaxID=185979 RepID=UPI000BF97098|nr:MULTISPECIES: GNAT family N-acetyltransferase [unclassified Bacillus (in: firmicutes)]PFO04945.1 GNAT family N-acetyltransferase [Bacillus sp. AFS076308]PGV51042.1 GNAT family N-acetyltransferase [Bacillus sp. AFS037270]
MVYKMFDLTEKESWHELLRETESQDIYFTPEYFEIYERNGEGEARLFVYDNGKDFVYYPFLLRDLSNLLIVKETSSKYGPLYDITSPYGYGGPITNVKDESNKKQLFNEFEESFRSYCLRKNIITEFVRFHPLIRNDQDYKDMESTLNRHTIYVDLSLDLDEIWANYDNKNRNRLRKAKANNYFTIVHRPPNELENFMRLYYKTMDKKNAYDYYYFKKDFFENSAELLKDQLELIEVVMEDKVIMSCFFMHYGDFIHYHLLGSDEDYLNFSPNNSLIHYVVEWAKAKGKKALHLGGGYTGDTDTLYRFKKRFNKYGDLPFYIGKKIHNQEIYDELIKDLPVPENYFPLYRHPDLDLHILSSNK